MNASERQPTMSNGPNPWRTAVHRTRRQMPVLVPLGVAAGLLVVLTGAPYGWTLAAAAAIGYAVSAVAGVLRRRKER
ncbi:hypothetical protein [Actinomadura violacea]|uniref:Uncharacterized protein n=1 Tax=Actinomadura violacea TaxID=2819934 RepID=A0ABS3RY07_9ACTN|nr:hypothetical protein [Actinomadura violacea]MBO2461625.1 hypothetical protein [Actinomadura violacea]